MTPSASKTGAAQNELKAAQRRLAVARARWRRVMFEMPKLSVDAAAERHEIEEAEARRQMIRADLGLFRLRGRMAS